MNVEDFIPEIVQSRNNSDYGIMLVELDVCSICNRHMITSPARRESPFPKWIKINFEQQLKNAGWVKRSSITANNKEICCECAKGGKAYFVCALCEQQKPTGKIQDLFGDPPEFLCTDCYEITPASVWEKKSEELYNSHRYDYD